MSEHFYALERGAHGQERFFATEHTRGPWSNDHQHGGPPSALLARALERAGERAQGVFVTRITIELLRPIPIAAPLEVETEVLSEGRSIHRIAAALVSGDKQLAVALALRTRVAEVPVPIHDHGDFRPMQPPDQCRGFEFPFFQHERGFHTAVEVRAAEGEFGVGKFGVWMRPRYPLVAGEATTTLQRVMLCSDAAHGVGAALDTERFSFVNPDLSVHLHRLPADEWLAMRSRTWSEPMGFGMCRAELSDRHGPLGLVLQSQLLNELV